MLLVTSEKHNKLVWQEKDSSVNLAASIPRYKSHRECLGIIDDKRPKEATTTEKPSRVKKFPNRRMGQAKRPTNKQVDRKSSQKTQGSQKDERSCYKILLELRITKLF